ncbi:hypothetical protein HD806DRAFT_535060 [Xylariaceae sp. AK1471]|nr:hypothetical protein HD806DRAFT_535060 [Xylariaceae sp. AK1471]
MELFWVRPKHRHTRRKGNNKETRKGEKESLAIQPEARVKGDPTKKKKFGISTHHRSREMSHLHRYPPYADFLPPDTEQQCACPYCFSRFVHPLPRNVNQEHEWDANPRRSGDRAHRNTPRMRHHEPDLNLEWPEPCRRPGQPTMQVDQVYVHPYSTHHYSFPVVDHSTARHGVHLTHYPACYMAVVPESATVQDIEAVIAHRPGLVAMARLLATEELLLISTYRCTRDLYRASLQLEVWDNDNQDGRPMNLPRRGRA